MAPTGTRSCMAHGTDMAKTVDDMAKTVDDRAKTMDDMAKNNVGKNEYIMDDMEGMASS